MKENGEYKIEKAIPIPRPRSRGQAAVLTKLKKGDSVVLPTNSSSAGATARRILGKGCYAARPEGEGTRVWRIK